MTVVSTIRFGNLFRIIHVDKRGKNDQILTHHYSKTDAVKQASAELNNILTRGVPLEQLSGRLPERNKGHYLSTLDDFGTTPVELLQYRKSLNERLESGKLPNTTAKQLWQKFLILRSQVATLSVA